MLSSFEILIEITVCLIGICLTIFLYYLSLQLVIFCISKSDEKDLEEPSFFRVYLSKTCENLTSNQEHREQQDDVIPTEIIAEPSLACISTEKTCVIQLEDEKSRMSHVSDVSRISEITDLSEKSILKINRSGEIKEKKTVTFSTEVIFSDYFSEDDEAISEDVFSEPNSNNSTFTEKMMNNILVV